MKLCRIFSGFLFLSPTQTGCVAALAWLYWSGGPKRVNWTVDEMPRFSFSPPHVLVAISDGFIVRVYIRDRMGLTASYWQLTEVGRCENVKTCENVCSLLLCPVGGDSQYLLVYLHYIHYVGNLRFSDHNLRPISQSVTTALTYKRVLVTGNQTGLKIMYFHQLIKLKTTITFQYELWHHQVLQAMNRITNNSTHFNVKYSYIRVIRKIIYINKRCMRYFHKRIRDK